MNNCSRCGKVFNDVRIRVALRVEMERIKTNEMWENIENSKNVSHEILCKDCFDIFAETMEKGMNIKYGNGVYGENKE